MKLTTPRIVLALSVGIYLFASCSAPDNRQPAPSTVQSAPPSGTQPAAAPQGPPVSINAEMVSFVDHAAHALWDVERNGNAPKTDEDWALVEDHATQLAAAGSLLRLPGTGVNDKTLTVQPDWEKWTRALSDAGTGALTASKAKDLKALVAANSQLVDACEGCHKRFKPALPSEGINHRHRPM
jgi:hypothetical protein